MNYFDIICNAIILVGGALLTIKTIAEWFGKPIRFVKRRNEEAFDEKVVAVLNRVLPSILLQHDLIVKETYKADRERYLQEIKAEVLKEIQGELNGVEKLSKQYDALVLSAKDVLREKIMQIYFKGIETRTITYHDREALKQYYKDYKAMKGNSYIDKYYLRMMGDEETHVSGWTVTEDNYDEQCAL